MPRSELSYRIESKVLSVPFAGAALTSFVSFASQEPGAVRIPYTSIGLGVFTAIAAVGLALEKARCDRHTV